MNTLVSESFYEMIKPFLPDRWILLGAALSPILVLGWWQYGPVFNNFGYYDGHARAECGTLYLTGKVRLNSPVVMEVNRWIEDKDGLLIALPSTSRRISSGVSTVTRSWELPRNIKPGHYKYISEVTVQANPIRSITIRNEPIDFEVGNGPCKPG